MTGQEAETIRKYKALVLKIGQGFHPDTPFEDYEPPILFMTAEAFNELMDEVFEIPYFDPYEAGLEMFAVLRDVETFS